MVTTVIVISLVVGLGVFLLWLASDRTPKQPPTSRHLINQTTIGVMKTPEWAAGADWNPAAPELRQETPTAKPKIVPSFDPRKRIKSLLAAGRYGWDVTLVYFDEAGEEHKVTIQPPDVKGVQRDKVNDIEITLDDGTLVPLNRIKYIYVDAATEDARDRYGTGPASRERF